MLTLQIGADLLALARLEEALPPHMNDDVITHDAARREQVSQLH